MYDNFRLGLAFLQSSDGSLVNFDPSVGTKAWYKLFAKTLRSVRVDGYFWSQAPRHARQLWWKSYVSNFPDG